jgi:GxxExxY protein
MKQFSTEEEYKALTYGIIGAAVEVHRELGAGLLESVYEHCLMVELGRCDSQVQRQVHLPIHYKGVQLDKEFVLDIVVENAVIVELKAVTEISLLHEAQLLTYLRLSGKKVGLLINFNALNLSKHGVKRKINGSFDPYHDTFKNSLPLCVALCAFCASLRSIV